MLGSLAKCDFHQDNKRIIFSLYFATPMAARDAGRPTGLYSMVFRPAN